MREKLIGSLLLTTILFPAPLVAQSGEAGSFQLEEIIVTAQKRAENQQLAPLSIAVLGGEELERRGITNIADLENTTPNLRIAPHGVTPTILRVFMRGLGQADSQITQDPPVGIYVNGIYIARTNALSLDIPNLERIEVLRGPQGTLYGRNSTGGAINVVTRRPHDKFSANHLMSFGNFSAVRAQTNVNIPITDKFYVSGSYAANIRNGWIKNLGVGPDFGKLDSQSYRFDARVLPFDGFTIDYSYDRAVANYVVDYFHLDVPALPDGLVPGLPTQPKRLSAATLAEPFQPSRDHASGHSITMALDTPIGELRSITGFRKVGSRAYNDYSANPFLTVFRNADMNIRQKQFSQELQLVGDTANRQFSYVAGLYYFRETGREWADDYFFEFHLPRDISIRNKSMAGYGQLTWRPGGETGRLAITGGLRYTKDDRKADNNIVPEVSRRDRKLAGTITVDYQLSDDVMVYAKLAQGYKAGGYNLRQVLDFAQSFGPENVLSYEAGLKSEWLDRRLRLNIAAFYMDYRDIQLDVIVPNQPDPTLTNTINAGKAWIRGLELEAALLPLDGLRLSVNYGLTDSKMTKVAGDDASLYKLVQSPRHMVSGSLQWDIVKLEAGTFSFNADASYRSSTASNARYLPYREIPGYTLANARLAYVSDRLMPGGEVTIAAWVRNVFDKEYFKEAFASFGSTHAQRVGSYGLPRTYGLEIKLSY